MFDDDDHGDRVLSPLTLPPAASSSPSSSPWSSSSDEDEEELCRTPADAFIQQVQLTVMNAAASDYLATMWRHYRDVLLVPGEDEMVASAAVVLNFQAVFGEEVCDYEALDPAVYDHWITHVMPRLFYTCDKTAAVSYLLDCFIGEKHADQGAVHDEKRYLEASCTALWNELDARILAAVVIIRRCTYRVEVQTLRQLFAPPPLPDRSAQRHSLAKQLADWTQVDTQAILDALARFPRAPVFATFTL